MKHPFHQILLYEIDSRIFCSEKKMSLFEGIHFFLNSHVGSLANEIWCMGIWKNSKKSGEIARTERSLMPEFLLANPNLLPSDVYGSPYSIFDYEPDPLVSDLEGLRSTYDLLCAKQKKLILDFVPNHMAIDSILIEKYPELFLKANDTILNQNKFQHPNGFIYAHGRDPFFNGWTDTIQWDFSNPNVETLHIEILKKISTYCDGVRCDMAMLPLLNVFKKTFNRASNYHWDKVIGEVKKYKPDFKFYAEVYWGLENELINLGFDGTYNKNFYDNLEKREYDLVFSEFHSETKSLEKKIFFIENHDEKRAFTQFGENLKNYFALICFLPGIHLFHQGQEFGFKTKIPVQLIRTKKEENNESVHSFYQRVFLILKRRDKTTFLITPNYSEINQRHILIRILKSTDQTELFIWNPNTTEVSGWIPYENGIHYKNTLIEEISNQSFAQPKKEQMYFYLKPGEAQWFIF
ncbi:alpha-amylase family glycosyl hydrolase [Leptospira sp. 96542]|nr:alpha-amylase family glycosyl hydrolase [Leptospira sp. 96542]